MKRIIVESPFAPRTPLPETLTRCQQLAHGLACDCYTSRCQDQAIGLILTPRCAWCEATRIRAAEAALHKRYLAACLRDSILRGETPYASHRLLTMRGVLRDDVPDERALGIRAGFVWREVSEGTTFYVDLGWSNGMRQGETHAKELRRDQISDGVLSPHWLDERRLGGEWEKLGLEMREKHK